MLYSTTLIIQDKDIVVKGYKQVFLPSVKIVEGR